MKALVKLLVSVVLGFALLGAPVALANKLAPEAVLNTWYKLMLELVRHTATYSPPVASRAFAYIGVTEFEVVASGNDKMRTLAGQLNGLKPLPARQRGKAYDDGVVVQAAMAYSVQNFFFNTGPTGQRAIAAMQKQLRAGVTEGVAADVVKRSEAYGKLVAAQIIAWSKTDGGAVVENMGFPMAYDLTKGPAHWVPTSALIQQQKPLLPKWGKNRTFAMKDGAACPLPPPPEYSEDKSSAFYKQAQEVFDTKKNLTPEQRAIAKFWSDDPMLSSTPPGHWFAIALGIFERDRVPLEKSVDVMARLGVAEADAFIGCWNVKYQYDLVRPISYIRKMMDPKWESVINTPPFPEYPSGHSTASAAAALVLTQAFGDHYAFEDNAHSDDGLPPRSYASFGAAANEAGLSRLYGGIHFRAAIERGQDQGRCIGAYAAALKTRR